MKFEEVDEIMKKISMGQYPEEPIVPTAEPFINTSGSISNLCWIPVASVSAIGSVAGSVRSNHYHQTDWHFIYVTDGLMYYYWRGANSLATPCAGSWKKNWESTPGSATRLPACSIPTRMAPWLSCGSSSCANTAAKLRTASSAMCSGRQPRTYRPMIFLKRMLRW